MKMVPVKPEWGQTLQPGYCGFITREHDFVDDGIQYFEHFETGLPFVHTFVIESCMLKIAGTNDLTASPVAASRESAAASTISIIEAQAQTGVHRANLNEYLGNPQGPLAPLGERAGVRGNGSPGTAQCFIRIPIGWTPEIGAKIVAAAATHIGEKYSFGLIVADALANTVAGHWINRLTRSVPDKFMCWLLNNQHTKICSQLVALALQSQFYLRLRGCLRRPADTLLPKELGNDPQIWDPIIYKMENFPVKPQSNLVKASPG